MIYMYILQIRYYLGYVINDQVVVIPQNMINIILE